MNNPTWTMKNGTEILIKDMSTLHIRKVLSMLTTNLQKREIFREETIFNSPSFHQEVNTAQEKTLKKIELFNLELKSRNLKTYEVL